MVHNPNVISLFSLLISSSYSNQASCGGHLELVEWLINKGFSLAETDLDGNTALLFAAWGGHRNLMEYLLRLGASLEEKNNNGHSVFLSAANGGRIEIVEWLLSEGFSIDETNNNGDTALLLAAYGGHLALVQRLLELGASLGDRNSCGFTPLLSGMLVLLPCRVVSASFLLRATLLSVSDLLQLPTVASWRWRSGCCSTAHC